MTWSGNGLSIPLEWHGVGLSVPLEQHGGVGLSIPTWMTWSRIVCPTWMTRWSRIVRPTWTTRWSTKRDHPSHLDEMTQEQDEPSQLDDTKWSRMTSLGWLVSDEGDGPGGHQAGYGIVPHDVLVPFLQVNDLLPTHIYIHTHMLYLQWNKITRAKTILFKTKPDRQSHSHPRQPLYNIHK